MQMSPATQSAAKPVRAKAKASAPADGTAKKPGRSRKKAPVATPAEEVTITAMYPTTEEMTGMIATAAYYIAAERHFQAGCELDDWLEAERRVRAQFTAD